MIELSMSLSLSTDERAGIWPKVTKSWGPPLEGPRWALDQIPTLRRLCSRGRSDNRVRDRYGCGRGWAVSSPMPRRSLGLLPTELSGICRRAGPRAAPPAQASTSARAQLPLRRSPS